MGALSKCNNRLQYATRYYYHDSHLAVIYYGTFIVCEILLAIFYLHLLVCEAAIMATVYNVGLRVDCSSKINTQVASIYHTLYLI